MKSLVGSKVNHAKYGNGTILEESVKRICVQFEAGEVTKEFLFPDSFEQYLKLEDEELQSEFYELAVSQRLEKERLENERREEIRLRELALLTAEKEKKKTTARRRTTKVATK